MLKLHINFFEKAVFIGKMPISKYLPFIEYKKIKKSQLIQKGGNIIYSKFINWINKYLDYANVFKNYIIPPIFIDFEIIKEKKEITNEILYNDYLKCDLNNHYDTVYNNFYSKITTGFLNITKSEEQINNISMVLLKNFDNILIIDRKVLYKNNFYFNDDLEIMNYTENYDTFYDLIIINNVIEINVEINNTHRCKTIIYFKKNIISLIWAIKHLNTNGYIRLLIRETCTPFSKDLLLLLSQFCKINIYYNIVSEPGRTVPLFAILTNFTNITVLIEYLEKILTFDIDKNTGFFKIKNIMMGDIDKFNKIILYIIFIRIKKNKNRK